MILLWYKPVGIGLLSLTLSMLVMAMALVFTSDGFVKTGFDVDQ